MTTPSTPPTPQKKKLPGWLKIFIILVIAFAVLSVLASIGLTILGHYIAGKGGEKVVEKGVAKLIEKGLKEEGIEGNVEFSMDKESFVLRNKKTGEKFAVRAAAELPKGFPSDIPLFKPSEIKRSAIIGPMTAVTLESSASIDQVSEYYKKELPTKGWSTGGLFEMGEKGFTGLFSKGERRLTVSVSPLGGEDKVSINLAYGVK